MEISSLFLRAKKTPETPSQAIIWTNAGILLIRPLRTNFSEILIAV